MYSLTLSWWPGKRTWIILFHSYRRRSGLNTFFIFEQDAILLPEHAFLFWVLIWIVCNFFPWRVHGDVLVCHDGNEKPVASKGVWSQLTVRRVTRRDFDYETKLILIRVRVTSLCRNLVRYLLVKIHFRRGDCAIFDYALNF